MKWRSETSGTSLQEQVLRVQYKILSSFRLWKRHLFRTYPTLLLRVINNYIDPEQELLLALPYHRPYYRRNGFPGFRKWLLFSNWERYQITPPWNEGWEAYRGWSSIRVPMLGYYLLLNPPQERKEVDLDPTKDKDSSPVPNPFLFNVVWKAGNYDRENVVTVVHSSSGGSAFEKWP